ncbi:uncharacterized protein PV09_09315 [Verruconis gallopava]|uniref:Methyltransferase domain-containing protein n=1 Tax=Verruconis gallopava TaxID=253628 RepID=A0A0D1ZXX2_9PEZI|nr:uncharacterized protein PV09_09315 [Verruconis gallopava]KIV98929.1 hypothetical protein PV09_09315 [Verruconis gallopava]
MPRLSPRLLKLAWKENPLLPLLLRACRDLNSARLELKWLREHAQEMAKTKRCTPWKSLLHQFCRARSLGQPIQYILGTEFFGELELICRPNVLIPRQDTSAWVLHLVEVLNKNAAQLPANIKVLDLCTGSGCIPLLFAHAFTGLQASGSTSLKLLGIDVSSTAIELANRNKEEQLTPASECTSKHLEFSQADIMSDDRSSSSSPPSLLKVLDDRGQLQWDIILSNPPYISPEQFNRVTARSVRKFEPKLALVPESQHRRWSGAETGDVFYPRLLELARLLESKVLVMEVGDLDQAKRVASQALGDGRWYGVEIWRDEPRTPDEDEARHGCVRIRGRGNGRSVICWTEEVDTWFNTH